MAEEEADLDSTQVLLDSTIGLDSRFQDESEDEVFFGAPSTKEKKKQCHRRDTVASPFCGLDAFRKERKMLYPSSSSSATNSIPEESVGEGEDVVKEDIAEKMGIEETVEDIVEMLVDEAVGVEDVVIAEAEEKGMEEDDEVLRVEAEVEVTDESSVDLQDHSSSEMEDEDVFIAKAGDEDANVLRVEVEEVEVDEKGVDEQDNSSSQMEDEDGWETESETSRLEDDGELSEGVEEYIELGEPSKSEEDCRFEEVNKSEEVGQSDVITEPEETSKQEAMSESAVVESEDVSDSHQAKKEGEDCWETESETSRLEEGEEEEIELGQSEDDEVGQSDDITEPEESSGHEASIESEEVEAREMHDSVLAETMSDSEVEASVEVSGVVALQCSSLDESVFEETKNDAGENVDEKLDEEAEYLKDIEYMQSVGNSTEDEEEYSEEEASEQSFQGADRDASAENEEDLEFIAAEEEHAEDVEAVDSSKSIDDEDYLSSEIKEATAATEEQEEYDLLSDKGTAAQESTEDEDVPEFRLREDIPSLSPGDESVFSRRSLEELSASTATFMEMEAFTFDQPDAELGGVAREMDLPKILCNDYTVEVEICPKEEAVPRSLTPDPMFDTTMDEMVLFDMYGENYDNVVEAMDTQEKWQLKMKVAEKKALDSGLKDRIRSRVECLGSPSSPALKMSVSAPPATSRLFPRLAPSLPSTGSPSQASPLSTAPLFPSLQPGPPEKASALADRKTPSKPVARLRPSPNPIRPRASPTSTRFRASPNPARLRASPTPNRLRASPTPARLRASPTPAMLRASPTPTRPRASPTITRTRVSPTTTRPRASPIPTRTRVSPSPTLTKYRTSPLSAKSLPPSRLPAPGFLMPSRPVIRTPGPLRSLKKAAAPVPSPVAEYLRSNPVPSLVTRVVAKKMHWDLESTLVEVDHKENLSPSLPSCPLPANTYRAAGLLQETQAKTNSALEFGYIPEAYGQQGGGEARVTKHLARRQVERDLMESPGSPLSMSVTETRVVRKFATPINRGALNM